MTIERDDRRNERTKMRRSGLKRTTGWMRETGDACSMDRCWMKRVASFAFVSVSHRVDRGRSRSRSIYRGRPGFPPFVRSFDPPTLASVRKSTHPGRRAIRFQPVQPSCRSCVWRPDLRGVLRGYRAMNDDESTDRRRTATRRCVATRCDTRPSPDRSDHPDRSDRSVDRTRRARGFFVDMLKILVESQKNP